MGADHGIGIGRVAHHRHLGEEEEEEEDTQ